MTMTFSKVLVGSLAAACSIALLGCAPDSSSSSQDGAASTRVEIYSWWTNPGEAEALNAVLSLHARNHASIEILNIATSQDASGNKPELRDLMDAHTPPDIFQANAYKLSTEWMGQGFEFEPLDSLFAAEGWNSVFAPEALATVTFGGHILALPVNMHRENGIFYNKSVFKNANGVALAEPKTWQEFRTICETLDAKGVVPMAVSSQGWIARFVFQNIAGLTMGAQRFASFFAGGQSLTTPNLFDDLDAAIANFALVVEQYSVITPTNWDVTANSIMASPPAAAMFAHGDWAKGLYGVLGQTELEYGVFAGGDGLFTFGADSFLLPANAPHKAEGLELLKTWGSAAGQAAFNTIKGSSPVRSDVDLSADPIAAKIRQDLATATQVIGSPGWIATDDVNLLFQNYAENPNATTLAALRDGLHAAYPHP